MRSYLSVGALRLLNELIGRARYEDISPYDLAVAFTGIKDQKAVAARTIDVSIRAAPDYQPLTTL